MEGKVAEVALNPFVLQFALIFMPGLLWARMHATFTVKGEQSGQEFLIATFFYGLISYGLVFIGFQIFKVPFQFINVTEADKHGVITSGVTREIGYALLAAFLGAIVDIYASTYSWLFKILRFIGATKRYGSEDVWDYTFNLSSANVEYVHVRDFKERLVYAGWVNAFSETEKLRELTLRDVQVFDFEGALFYEVPRLYLARKPEGLHVEFPAVPKEEVSDGKPAPPINGARRLFEAAARRLRRKGGREPRHLAGPAAAGPASADAPAGVERRD